MNTIQKINFPFKACNTYGELFDNKAKLTQKNFDIKKAIPTKDVVDFIKQNNGKILDLSYANLSNADLKNEDLSKAYLSNADLSNTDLSNANLSIAYLVGAKLLNTDLSNANLTDACLAWAIYNKNTKFPTSFNPKDHGMILQDL